MKKACAIVIAVNWVLSVTRRMMTKQISFRL